MKRDKENINFLYKDEAINSVENDAWGMNSYVSGLKEYILSCDSPMTISIQGDWGTGKTSMMNMLKEALQGESETIARIVEINAWAYSQFNAGNNLAFNFLVAIVNEVIKNNSEINGESIKKNDGEKPQLSLYKLVKGLGTIGAVAVDSLVGNRAGDLVESLVKNFDVEDFSIGKIKEDFKDIIAPITSGGKKVVFLVDDLDRLQPGKAIEILEMLKNFLDVEGCVFVLAIDYQIVEQGTRDKYGDILDSDKARKFFDKIIQVPFNIPYPEETTIKSYIEKGLCIEDVDEKILNVIRYSIGMNPRAIKRIINIVNLYQKFHEGNPGSGCFRKDIWFTVICMQNEYPQLFNDLYDDDMMSLEIDGQESAKEQKFVQAIKSVFNEDDMNLMQKIIKRAQITNSYHNDELIEELYVNVEYKEQRRTLRFVKGGHKYYGFPALLILLADAYMQRNGREALDSLLKGTAYRVIDIEQVEQQRNVPAIAKEIGYWVSCNVCTMEDVISFANILTLEDYVTYEKTKQEYMSISKVVWDAFDKSKPIS